MKKSTNEFGVTWWVGRIPPEVLRENRRPDPIYAPLSLRGYRACCEFIDQAKEYLLGNTSPPNLKRLIDRSIPHGSLLSAALSKDELGPKLLLKIEDLDRLHEREERSPRWFDPEYLPGFIMLTYAGGSFRHDDKRRKKDPEGNLTEPSKRRLIVSFGRGADGNVSLLRIIDNVFAGYQVFRKSARSNKDYHYEYRRAAFEQRSDDRVRMEFSGSKTARRGRAHAFELAGKHFLRAQKRGEALADPALTCENYEAMLSDFFCVGDALYEARQALSKKRR